MAPGNWSVSCNVDKSIREEQNETSGLDDGKSPRINIIAIFTHRTYQASCLRVLMDNKAYIYS